MSSSGQLDSGGGGGGFSLSEFIRPNANRLFARIDFLGFIERVGGAAALAIYTTIIAIPLGLAGAFDQLLGGFEFSLVATTDAFVGFLIQLSTGAQAAAAGDLGQFEVFALPVSAAAAVGPVLAVIVVFVLFVGGGS